MHEGHAPKKKMRRTTKVVAAIGIAICLLALWAIATSYFAWLYLLLPLSLGIASIRGYTRQPRRRTWFVPGAAALALLIGGIILGALLCRTDPLHVKIPPVSYVRAPLPRILQDLCRYVHTRDTGVSFNLESDLKAKAVDFQTKRAMPLEQFLNKLADGAGCSFRYGRCGTGGGLIGSILVFSASEHEQGGEAWVSISENGIREYGAQAAEDSQEPSKRTRSSGSERPQ